VCYHLVNGFVVTEAVPCIRTRMCGLCIAITVEDEMASHKRFSTSYVLSKLDLSDDDCFDDNDSNKVTMH